MEKKESKVKKELKDNSLIKEEQQSADKTTGFPKDVDFKKFLGCGG